MSDWFSNDSLFKKELSTGHRYAEAVADALRATGLKVAVTPMEVRRDIDDRHRFRDEHDLVVGDRAPCRVDVKSRDIAFKGAKDYPFPTAFVDTVAGWNAKVNKPMAIVLVSQRTGSMMVISTRNAPSGWGVSEKRDRVRDIVDRFYTVARSELREFDELVAWLRRREDHDGPGT